MNMTLGKRAKSRRKELGLTQKEVAAMAGVAHVTISQWESEDTKPNGARLLALSRALKCSPEWLLEGEGQIMEAEEAIKLLPALTPIQTELLELFDSLTESEKEAEIRRLRAMAEDNRALLAQLLKIPGLKRKI